MSQATEVVKRKDIPHEFEERLPGLSHVGLIRQLRQGISAAAISSLLIDNSTVTGRR
jgi:hypothetical protein